MNLSLDNFRQLFTCDHCKRPWDNKDNFPRQLYYRIFYREHFVSCQISLRNVTRYKKKSSILSDDRVKLLKQLDNNLSMELTLLLSNQDLLDSIDQIALIKQSLKDKYLHRVENLSNIMLRKNINNLIHDVTLANNEISIIQPKITSTLENLLYTYYTQLQSIEHAPDVNAVIQNCFGEFIQTTEKIQIELRFIEVPLEKWDDELVRNKALQLL